VSSHLPLHFYLLPLSVQEGEQQRPDTGALLRCQTPHILPKFDRDIVQGIPAAVIMLGHREVPRVASFVSHKKLGPECHKRVKDQYN